MTTSENPHPTNKIPLLSTIAQILGEIETSLRDGKTSSALHWMQYLEARREMMKHDAMNEMGDMKRAIERFSNAAHAVLVRDDDECMVEFVEAFNGIEPYLDDSDAMSLQQFKQLARGECRD